MVKERKIRCDCGSLLEEQKTEFDHFRTDAMVCPKCGFTTLTKNQAKRYSKLKQLHSIIDSERKIIRIGNSMGITFPERLQEYGAEVGKRVKLEALSHKSFKIELI